MALCAAVVGRNPLIRISDRVEALVLVLAVVVSLLAIPIAAAVGTAVHDSRSSLYAEQAQARRMVTATVVGERMPARTYQVRQFGYLPDGLMPAPNTPAS